VMVLVLWIYIAKDGNFKFSRVGVVVKNDKWKFVNYGVFTVLSNSSFVMIQNLDTIMLSLLTKQSFIYVGIYGTFFSIAVVISLPAKALSRTSLQIVSQAWASNDLGKIGKVYYKTSVVQMLIGLLLFTGLVVNKQFIIMLLHKPEYAGCFDVFVVVGIAFLVDMTGGLNNYIINLSKYYRLTTVFYISGVVLCLVSNWILIPRMGMMGAAISYLVTIFVLNFAYWLFIKIKFDLQPFAKAHLYILLIFTCCLLIGLYLPPVKNLFIDMLYRSVIVGIVYTFLTYILKISEDINLIFDRILKRGN
jgi:O-antigen/teichoic acid export membrane protein